MKLPFILLALTTAAVFSQGPLTPPGAPAPTQKSLDQIEPRTDVRKLPGDATAMHVISQPGSYFLSGNLQAASGMSGIRIAVGNVSLDLMGFQVKGTQSAGTVGILAGAVIEQILISNGIIDDFETLIGPPPSSVGNFNSTVVSRVTGTARGGYGYGFRLGLKGRVEYCKVKLDPTGSIAIFAAEVHHCEASGGSGQATIEAGNVSHSVGTSGYVGISASYNVTDCHGQGTQTGISASNVLNSKGVAGSAFGILATDNVHNSTGRSSGGIGIAAGGGFLGPPDPAAGGNVSNSTGYSSSSTGIGIQALTISGSRGATQSGGEGLVCNIAIGCTSTGNDSITNKYNMP